MTYSGIFRFVLSLGISGLALYLALRDVDLAQVYYSLRNAEASYLELALVSVMINVFSKASRWQVLVSTKQGESLHDVCGVPVATKVSFNHVFKALMVGQMLNWVFPMRIGDISRIYIIGGMGPGKSFIFGTVALEKVLDILAFSIIFLGLILVYPLPTWISESGYYLTILAIILLLSVIIIAKYQIWFAEKLGQITILLPKKAYDYLIPNIRTGLYGLGVINRASDLVKLGVWSILVWGTAVWTNYLIAQALRLDIPWTAAIVILLVLQVGISFSQVPGMVGVFQYACILTLAMFGVNQFDGVSYGILLHITVMLPIIVLGLFYFWQLGLNNVKWHEG